MEFLGIIIAVAVIVGIGYYFYKRGRKKAVQPPTVTVPYGKKPDRKPRTK